MARTSYQCRSPPQCTYDFHVPFEIETHCCTLHSNSLLGCTHENLGNEDKNVLDHILSRRAPEGKELDIRNLDIPSAPTKCDRTCTQTFCWRDSHKRAPTQKVPFFFLFLAPKEKKKLSARNT